MYIDYYQSYGWLHRPETCRDYLEYGNKTNPIPSTNSILISSKKRKLGVASHIRKQIDKFAL